ncbi:hypothetical protein BZG35_00105 [Brevundimonas sp. LM2]|nr:hypothetical protein [Brevundimonas sp. LM2]AQR60235.1 hypothetical protein BZG35_00105 [Brevundimonas sp. LM2]
MGVVTDGELKVLLYPRPATKLRQWPFWLLAIAAASVLAGLLIALEFAALVLVANVVERAPLRGLVAISIYAGSVGAAGFGAGIILLGSPLWLWLHGIGKRSYLTAAVAGSALASLGTAGWTVVFGGMSAPALAMIGWVVLPGALAGLLIRWIAYEPAIKLPPARPS